MICLALESEINGKVEIPDEQKKRIINLDESCPSLDESDGTKGGHPVVSFYDPALPNLGRVASKSSTTATVICGSSAFGEAMPPHLQICTTAKTCERQKIQLELLQYLSTARGQFGHLAPQCFPVTIGMNEKGGMDEEEFGKYLIELIDMIFPDAADVDGKRVIVKIDSGPGRTNPYLLAYTLAL